MTERGGGQGLINGNYTSRLDSNYLINIYKTNKYNQIKMFYLFVSL